LGLEREEARKRELKGVRDAFELELENKLNFCFLVRKLGTQHNYYSSTSNYPTVLAENLLL
jgi:hypothetical protein